MSNYIGARSGENIRPSSEIPTGYVTSFNTAEQWNRLLQEDWSLDFYSLLRKLITGGSWSEGERDGAVELVNRLEQLGVFGTTVSTITEKRDE